MQNKTVFQVLSFVLVNHCASTAIAVLNCARYADISFFGGVFTSSFFISSHFLSFRASYPCMIDIKYLLEQPDKVAENNTRRGKEIDVSFAVKHAKDRAESLEQVQELRTKANELSKTVSIASAEDRPVIIEQGKQIKE